MKQNESKTALISRVARDVFGIRMVKPFQMLVMERILEQDEGAFVRHQLVILPTGTGKSLCFLVPAVLCKGLTIIVYPLLALMNDQMSKLEKAGIDCVALRGGQTKEQRARIWRKLDCGTKIVVTTPETLLMQHVLAHLSHYDLSLLVIDEAHVIAQWGKDFRPQYAQLKKAVFELMPKQVLGFTATASKETTEFITKHLFPSRPLVVKGDADRENIVYGVYRCLERTQGVVDILEKCERPALVFCRTRHETQQLCFQIARDLTARGKARFPTRYYHAGLSRNERETLEQWFAETKDGVLVTTCAFGMGVDVRSIRTVIHFGLPKTVEEYLQESGRAGRDGKPSMAWVLQEEVKTYTDDEHGALVQIFAGNSCRRRGLLAALGNDKDECTGCDICLGGTMASATQTPLLRSFARLFAFRFTIEKASYVLTGNRDFSVVDSVDEANPFYGTMENWNCMILKETLANLCDIGSIGIGYVRFCRRGRLVYRTDIPALAFIASVLGRIDRVYCRVCNLADRVKDTWKGLTKRGRKALTGKTDAPVDGNSEASPKP